MKRGIRFILSLGILLITGICFAQPKGELVVCQGGEVNSLDNAKHNSMQDQNYAIQVFDMLFYRDGQGIPQPRLAVSHKAINDTTWEFKLRTGVKFHNETIMSAKDVKFSIDRMINPETKALYASFYSTIGEVKVIDDSTIHIITKGPDPLLLKRLSHNLHILPSELFKEKGAEAFFQQPMGTGPFKFVSWTRNDRMVFDANVTYWDGAPKVKRLVMRPVPEVAARIAELQTGNADIVTSIPPFLVSQVKNLRNATVQTIPSGRAIFLYLNSLGDGPLKNKKVRQALNYAVDRKVIVENILLGSGVVTPINITPYHFGHDPSLKPYPYDPGKAKELLAEAGYASGLKLEFCTPTGRYQLDKEVSEAIAGMFNKVGIQTDFKVVEWATYLQTLTGGKLKDVGFIGFANALHDVDGTFTPFYTKTPFSYYHTPDLAEKITAARTMLDEKKRLELYKEIQREIYEEAPVVFLYQQVDHYGVSRALNGFQVRNDEQIVLYQVGK